MLLAPLGGTALLAEQVATLDRLSGGRFTLGLGVGGRADDHAAAGVDPRTRGRRLDEQLVRMRDVVATARAAMGAYYGSTGDADRMLGGLLTTPDRVRETVRAYADLGADEVVLYCWATDAAQVDRMADLVS